MKAHRTKILQDSGIIQGSRSNCRKYHAEVSQVILNWTVQQSYVSSALIGITSMKHVEENLKTFDYELTEEEIQLINDEVKRLELDK